MILYIRTAVGVKLVDTFHIVTAGDRWLQLVAALPKPAKPGVAPRDVTLQKLDLTVATSSKKPYKHGVADDSIRPPTGDLLRRARALGLDAEGRR